ncbi:type 1 glutamine amidotransferase domain-containing protein [Weissella sagaensis]|uniref:Type 1 glutamine amidotransferase domain-containing protein n=1 Tax=Weissella sagaensis TaxID=2559928 RepID=A0ABW1RS93_9LACO|nr:type 1 glutamine amidotransferase domain-containing protein [Weissella sagaensis]KAA8433943.1 type 1 glutamine amidotransferase [Weissella paramesenteroides]MBU7568147.1 type 1 glutamine amidotransferase [Weissella hellenica]KAA8438287.1 type 1 glutamine amidotransferase [Weissella paramesenteroides]QDJ58179.1 type 1 glutamine amidotransferase [Weissella hellenica]QEA57175.1 type 1 glutamine amidotransferase [Weissella hellenica]
MAKEVAVVVTDLVEDVEYTEPVEAIKAAGHNVTTIGFEEGTVEGKHGTKITIDKSIADVKPEDFDALFIPGGFSPDQLRADQRFVDFTKVFLAKNKLTASICHGPQLMIQTGLVHGRTMTSYLTVQPDLYYAGARIEDESVVIDGNLITSREPKDIPAFNEAVVKALA